MLASVLLPFRDAERTIADALDSLLAEEGDFEVVAIDDGSCDASAEIVSTRAERDRRLVLVRTPPRGLVHALELARSLARAEFLVRMDADDIHRSPRVRACVNALVGDEHLAIVGTRVDVLSDEPVGDGLARYVAWQNTLQTPEEHALEAYVESPICHPTFAIRREVLESLGGYRDGDFPEDYDLLLRIHEHGLAMAKLPLVGLAWRHTNGRLTFRDPRYSPDAFRRLKVEHLAPRLRRETRPVVLWGAGRDGRRFLRDVLGAGVTVSSVVDISPRKIGRVIYTLPIIAPDGLPPAGEAFIVVSVGTRGARGLIRADLTSRGYQERVDFVCVA